MNQQEVHDAVNALWDDHEIMRSIFQFMKPEVHVDRTFVDASRPGGSTPYGRVHLKEAITDQFVVENNARGHRLNHAFVVALWAILEDFSESHPGFKKQTTGQDDPWPWLGLCELLRAVAGHGQRGRYIEGTARVGTQRRWTKNSRKLTELMGQLIDEDALEATLRNGEQHFNFSKTTVLRPLRAGCLRCIDAWFRETAGR